MPSPAQQPGNVGKWRRWFQEEGFEELEFIAPADVLFSVATFRFSGSPQPLRSGHLFRFVR